jgi:gliding motility-associated-like protein
VKTILPLFIPNVFKPDGDGKNETFIIRASHRFERLELVIFNRWGDIVYASTDYQNDWNAEGLLPGTYYYQVKGIGIDKKEKQYKGWVQVIK